MKSGQQVFRCYLFQTATLKVWLGLWICIPLTWVFPAGGGILGTNVPSRPLTRERIATLPEQERAAWTAYLERSERLRELDRATFQRELRSNRLDRAAIPPYGRAFTRTALNADLAWFASPEGKRIADIVISFQTPAGGWSKNLDVTHHVRAPGEGYAPDNSSPRPGAADYDPPNPNNWSYIGTFDNDATISQLQYLAKVIRSMGVSEGKVYRDSFLRGLVYVFDAQYPNGGWPQVYPLQGGYHDAITYNDNAVVNVLTLLRDVSAGEGFDFVPADTRARAAASLQRGIRCLLSTQIVVAGRRTCWGQQHDVLTLKPVSARNYEMPAQAAAESAGIMLFLMQMPNPNAEVVAAVHAAAAWLEKTSVRDMAFRQVDGKGRMLVSEPGGELLWARFYEIGSDRPLFGDRDKTIHDRLEEISEERRNRYLWYSGSGRRAIEYYRTWSREHSVVP